MDKKQVLITGGAGYIGSMLCGVLLNKGYGVTVVDKLMFGGESLLPYFLHPDFHFTWGDVTEKETFQVQGREIKAGSLAPAHYDAVVHLAALVGFPACKAAGTDVSFRTNTESTKRMFGLADATGAERFVFSSTYSNYGLSKDGLPVTEESPLFPQSLYAETKIAAEEFLLGQGKNAGVAPLVFRFATLFGVSPRTRFDLIINQFVLEAMTQHKLLIYQRNYSRSFVHIRDVGRAVRMVLEAPLDTVRGEVLNVGADELNCTKDEIIALVQKHVPETVIEYKDLSFGGDMRDIRVSFAKVKRVLGFVPEVSIEQGVVEVRDALRTGLIRNPLDDRYRNAQFIVQ